MRGRKRRGRTPEQQRRRASRKRHLFRVVGRVAFLGVLLAAAVLALTIFFRVDTITVEGAKRYTPDEIIAQMDVRQGDNLYLWNKMKTSEHLLAQFPYLDTVQIRRHLPDGLVVTVTESEPAAAVAAGGVYYLVSAKGKVLEQVVTDNGLPRVTGVSFEVIRPGQILDPASDLHVDALLTVLTELESGGLLAETDFVNLQSLTDVRIGYQGRFDIRVGIVDELAYRLRFVRTVIEERLSPSDVGRLYWDARGRLHFVPDSVENVAASATGTEQDDSPIVDPSAVLEFSDTPADGGSDADAGEGGADASDADESGADAEETPNEE